MGADRYGGYVDEATRAWLTKRTGHGFEWVRTGGAGYGLRMRVTPEEQAIPEVMERLTIIIYKDQARDYIDLSAEQYDEEWK